MNHNCIKLQVFAVCTADPKSVMTSIQTFCWWREQQVLRRGLLAESIWSRGLRCCPCHKKNGHCPCSDSDIRTRIGGGLWGWSKKDCSPWLNKFISKHGIHAALVEVLEEHHITSETNLAGITERDLSDMRLVVGHKIILCRLIATLNKPSDSSTDLAPSLPGSSSPEVLLMTKKAGEASDYLKYVTSHSKTYTMAFPFLHRKPCTSHPFRKNFHTCARLRSSVQKEFPYVHMTKPVGE